MREIKFRGLRVDGKGWVYGYYFIDLENKKTYIHLIERENTPDGWMVKCYEVIPESVGEFTGLTDKNGVEICEFDIVKTPKGIATVTFDLGCFYVITCSRYRLGGWDKEAIEVIGNKFENPELL